MEITKDTTLEKILGSYPIEAARILARHGLHTLSCPNELYQPLWRVAQSRDMAINRLIVELNKINSA